MTRRDYKAGSLYQRKRDWLWVATIEDGWTATGTRKRIVVTAKGCEGGCPKRCSHRTEIQRRVREKERARDRGEIGVSARETVKSWAETYLAMRVRELSPKGYNAAASPINLWVVPTIGHRRLDQLTPADIRAVADAQRRAGRQSADTHRAMRTMLKAAVREGHAVPPRVFEVKAAKPEKSDRLGMTVPEGLACIQVASTLDHGSRWLATLLYGMRKGECLGLTWDAIDFDAGRFGEIRIEWQLQSLPYNVKGDRSSGFRVPDGHESRHLVDAFHLTRPKSRQGWRVAPMLEPVRDGLLAWREKAPESPWGLVWPTTEGRPANDKHDLAEWHGLQNVAEVSHPSSPRPFHVHECRNFAATMLLEAGVDDHVITSLLGHASIVMSRKYMTVRREPLYDALAKVGERLQLG